MTPERWRQITDVFHKALARDASARGALLDEACAGDPALRAEVDAMLAAHRDAGSFGERPPVTLTGETGPRLGRGSALGPYRIEALIGAGGMGEVYRAHDERLGRAVAIKVLPSHVAGDPHLKQRLEREAKALATLSHPHICPVFDVGQQDGIDYLVMEYLEGETLASRLAKGPLPLRQALQWAVEIAGALDAAHRRGVVHRDLKPGNVMLTKGGARLLDFGLARLRPSPMEAVTTDRAGAQDTSLTGEGRIVGTLQYMAPEQLNGADIDARTDIFAFGAVVYEMVTGRRAFEAKTQASLIAAILEHDAPTVSTLVPTSPPALDHLIRTCLAKDPDQRWQSAGDLERNLRWLVVEGSQPGVAVPATTGMAGVRLVRTSRLAWIVAAGITTLVAALAAWRLTSTRVSPLLQSVLLPPPGVQHYPSRGFALSPDGSRLAFVAQEAKGASMLWVRSLAALEARPLGGTERATCPFWSPDGRDIGFFAFGEALKRVPAAGGAVHVLAGPAPNCKGGAWAPDGRIVFVPDSRKGLFEVPANGGQARPLTTLDAGAGELSHRWPQFLPDGRTLLFLVQTAEEGAKDDRSRLEALDASGARREIVRVNASAAYAPPGRLLFWRDGSIHAQEFDSKRLRLLGDARLVAQRVGLTDSEWATFSASHEGTLIYAPHHPWQLEWRERSGRLLSVAAPEGQYADAALSPDGRRVVYVANILTVRIRDLVRGTDTRLTFENRDHFSPVWAPQGDWVAYSVDLHSREGSEICRRRSSGLGDKEVLYTSKGQVVWSLSWSPDGRWIAFDAGDDLFLLDVDSREARTRVSTPAVEESPTFSRDGRWLAYVSDESGRREVYVVPALDGPGKWQASIRGGSAPRWGPSGRELYFKGPDSELMVVRVGPGKEPEFGSPDPLFALHEGPGWPAGFDVAPDGRILVTVQHSQGDAGSFRLVQNWPRLLEQPPR